MQSLVSTTHRSRLGSIVRIAHRLQHQSRRFDKNDNTEDGVIVNGPFYQTSFSNRQDSYSLKQSNEVLEHLKNKPETTETVDERIVLNVSGLTFETYRKNLLKFPNTLLGNPEKIEKFYEVNKEQYFLPRNRAAFDGILYFYQTGGSVYRPQNVHVEEFYEELKFFELGEEILQEFIQREKVCLDCVADTPELLQDGNSRTTMDWGKCSTWMCMFVIILSVVLLLVETLPSLHTHFSESNFVPYHLAFASIFTVEFILRWIFSSNKKAFFFTVLTLFDVISIPPFYLVVILDFTQGISDNWIVRFLKFLRLLRIFQLGRHIEGMRIYAKTFGTSFNDILMMIFLLIVGMVLFSSGVYYTQSHGVYEFKSIPDAFWYSVITMTTVGYGDIVPATDLGKLIGACCALNGLLVLALMVPIIAANFDKHYQDVKYTKKHAPCKLRRQIPQPNPSTTAASKNVKTNDLENGESVTTNASTKFKNGIENRAYNQRETNALENVYDGVSLVDIEADITKHHSEKIWSDDSDYGISMSTSPRSDLDRMDFDGSEFDVISNIHVESIIKKEFEDTHL